MQRQGKRTAIVFVVLSLALLAAHHAGLHTTHQQGAPTHHAMAADHEMPADMSPPAEPASGADVVVAICLAVLPVLLLAALVALGALVLRGWWRLPAGLALVLGVPLPSARAAPARDGPRELCVVRC